MMIENYRNYLLFTILPMTSTFSHIVSFHGHRNAADRIKCGCGRMFINFFGNFRKFSFEENRFRSYFGCVLCVIRVHFGIRNIITVKFNYLVLRRHTRVAWALALYCHVIIDSIEKWENKAIPWISPGNRYVCCSYYKHVTCSTRRNWTKKESETHGIIN